MDNPIVFLDIDGPLNGHRRLPNGYCGTTPNQVANLNKILTSTDSNIVITSSWRYLVLSGHMTILGFESLLLTHGVKAKGRVVGVVGLDLMDEVEMVPLPNQRGRQVSEWIAENGPVGRYVVIDDMDLGISAAGHPFVKVQPNVGLVGRHVQEAIKILGGEVRRGRPGQGGA